MNINSVTNSTNTIITPQSNLSNTIKLLEKQKALLQEQIQKVSESKQDDKTKQERIKQLQEQINQVDVDIQQIRNEMIKQKQGTKRQKESQTSDYGNEDKANTAAMQQLVQASDTYEKAKIINNTRENLQGKANVLKIEIKQDEARRGVAKAKREELQEVEARERKLGEKAAELTGITRKQVKEAQKEENEENNKADEHEYKTDSIKHNGLNYTNVDIRI